MGKKLYLCGQIITNIIFMTEEQKQSIIESGKDYFRRIIIPSHLKNLKTLKLKDFNVNPFTLIYINVSPESLAKALVYPRVWEVCSKSASRDDIAPFVQNLLRAVDSEPVLDSMIEFDDAIDGRRKYCLFSHSTDLDRKQMNCILTRFKHIMNEKSQGGLSFRMDDLIVGVLFGEPYELSDNYTTIQTCYTVYCGTEFWERLTGDELFYHRLVKAFCEVLEDEHTENSALIRQMVKEIAQEIRGKTEEF